MRFLIIFLFFLFSYANQKISIQLDWKYQFEFAGYIAAKEKGFYKELGVDVDLIEYHNNNIVNDVLNGKYQFGIYDNNLINQKIEGKPVKLVASIFKRSALVLIVDNKIKSLKQLENQKIMMADKDLNTFKDFLSDNGVDVSKIEFIPTNYSLEPFIDKKVEGFSAFITDEPYLLREKGIEFNIINPSDYNFLMYQGEFFTNKKFANENPILVDKVKKATIKGWEYALNHKEELVNIIYDKYSKRKSKNALFDEANQIEKIIQRRIYPIGFIDKELLKSQFLYESTKLHKSININKVVNDYIFEFENPLNLSNKYLFFIKLYNYYLLHKTNLILSFVFILILSIISFFYLKLKRQKDEIYTLFNKAPIAYVLMDIKNRVVLNANHYAYTLFGVNESMILNKTTEKFYITNDDYLKFEKIVKNYINIHQTIDNFSLNWQYKKLNGDVFWVNIRGMFYDLNKNKILWILNDITDVINNQNKLKTAMKVKEEFLANMSHEIRTPLNAILGFVDIIYNKEKDEENKKYLEVIKKSGKSLLTIINDILDFSKIESGKLRIEKIEFNPKDEFETLISLFESKAQEKNIDLKISFSGLTYMLISDPTRIKQVISNLISNAIKFTPKNKEVFCNINYNSKTEKLYVEIIDEGIGIPKNKLKDIFEAFAQADSSTTRKYGGSGLGLTISKNLISLLGGKLNVESEINEGTKFYFSIPVKKSVLIEKKEKKEKKEIHKEKFNANVLLVEDNKANQMFFKVILNSLGIKNIEIANDGVEGLEKASNKFDIIFMDENMPNMNGLEASRKIKEKGIKTPIIAVTANSLSGDKERFLKVMDDYIPKPVEKDKLVEILHKYLKEVK